MNTTNANTITLTTATLGRLTFTVMANRDSRWNDHKSLRCWIVSEPFDFKFGGIEYTCNARIGHYHSSNGLEPLRLEDTNMTRKAGPGGPTDNAQSALWRELREFVDLMRRSETFESIWRMTCSDAEDSVLREKARAIEELEQKLRKLDREREAYERMAQQPPASAIV